MRKAPRAGTLVLALLLAPSIAVGAASLAQLATHTFDRFLSQSRGLRGRIDAVALAPHGPFRAEAGLEKGRFLVASRRLRDPNFAESVVVLLHYDSNGAVGLVINQPTEVPVSTLFSEIEELKQHSDTVHIGGPVARNRITLLVRTSKRPERSERILENVYVTPSQAALREAIGDKGSGTKFRAYAGHAGWGPGQLDGEVAGGFWYVSRPDPEVIFDTNAGEIWPELLRRNSGDWTRRPRPPGAWSHNFSSGAFSFLVRN